jgi:hypothetical protein
MKYKNVSWTEATIDRRFVAQPFSMKGDQVEEART